ITALVYSVHQTADGGYVLAGLGNLELLDSVPQAPCWRRLILPGTSCGNISTTTRTQPAVGQSASISPPQLRRMTAASWLSALPRKTISLVSESCTRSRPTVGESLGSAISSTTPRHSMLSIPR